MFHIRKIHNRLTTNAWTIIFICLYLFFFLSKLINFFIDKNKRLPPFDIHSFCAVSFLYIIHRCKRMIRGEKIDRIWSEAILKFYGMMSFRRIDRCLAGRVQLVAKIFEEFVNILSPVSSNARQILAN